MTRSAKGCGGDAFPGIIDSTSDVGPDSNDDPDSPGDDSFSVDFGNTFGDDDDDEHPGGDAGEHALSINAISGDFGELGADLSPWAPLLGMLDSTEPEASPGDRPFTPTEGAEEAHALELRAESMLQYSERGAERTGELDRTEVGVSDDNRDVVAGRDQVEIDGMLDEHTGHGLVHVADEVELNVGGPLRMHAHLEDNIIMAGVMTDEWKGGTFITAAMSDDMAAGLGLRCTAPLDVWVHGLVGMEERPGTCAAAGVLLELAGTLCEREYGPSVHGALVARHSGTVVTTMKTGFRPLMKTALGVRNLIPGGGEAAGAVTLTAAESGGALGRGVAGSDDTDEIVSVVRTVESASDTAEVENLQHPAGTGRAVLVVPTQRENLRMAASGEHQQPDGRNRRRPHRAVRLRFAQCTAQAPVLLGRQEPLARMLLVAAHGAARIASRGNELPRLGALQHARSNPDCRVGGAGFVTKPVMQRGYLPAPDRTERHPTERRHDVQFEHAAIRGDGARLAVHLHVHAHEAFGKSRHGQLRLRFHGHGVLATLDASAESTGT